MDDKRKAQIWFNLKPLSDLVQIIVSSAAYGKR